LQDAFSRRVLRSICVVLRIQLRDKNEKFASDCAILTMRAAALPISVATRRGRRIVRLAVASVGNGAIDAA
jgi:hypothetical protein